VGLPEDIANAVAFLVSEQASYISGEALDVNGALYID
jgi:3-oxoacyl-[acyl-carrier protein] reductase